MPIGMPGIPLVVASAVVAVIAAFPLRTRLPAWATAFLLAAAGAGLGWGGMLLQPDPPVWEVVLTVVLLAILVPFHVRIVLGPLGARRET